MPGERGPASRPPAGGRRGAHLPPQLHRLCRVCPRVATAGAAAAWARVPVPLRGSSCCPRPGVRRAGGAATGVGASGSHEAPDPDSLAARMVTHLRPACRFSGGPLPHDGSVPRVHGAGRGGAVAGPGRRLAVPGLGEALEGCEGGAVPAACRARRRSCRPCSRDLLAPPVPASGSTGGRRHVRAGRFASSWCAQAIATRCWPGCSPPQPLHGLLCEPHLLRHGHLTPRLRASSACSPSWWGQVVDREPCWLASTPVQDGPGPGPTTAASAQLSSRAGTRAAGLRADCLRHPRVATASHTGGRGLPGEGLCLALPWEPVRVAVVAPGPGMPHCPTWPHLPPGFLVPSGTLGPTCLPEASRTRAPTFS